MEALLTLFALLRETVSAWSDDKSPRLAAAFAYYMLFSLAPLMIILIAIAGMVFGKEAAQGQLAGQMEQMVGKVSAQSIQELIASAHRPSSGIIATAIGTVSMLLGAAAVFGQLQDALDTIWGVEAVRASGIKQFIRDRVLSFAMVLGVGFLLMVSTVMTIAIGGMTNVVGSYVPVISTLTSLINLFLSFLIVFVLFAMIYKMLPNLKLKWNDVLGGAGLAAFLFTLGKWIIGLYLSKSGVSSAYGAAGSLVVLLLWIYYSAQILFFGAEFTKVYAHKFGSYADKSSPSAQIEIPT